MRKYLQKHPIIYSLLAGMLLSIAWVPVSLTPLLFIAFVPLFHATLSINQFKKALVYTYPAFFIWTLSTMYWIGNMPLDVTGLILLILVFILIPLSMSLVYLLFWYTTRRIHSKLILFTFPVYWITYEFLHYKWDLSFTWLHLGLGLSPFPKLIQFYEVLGLQGGTLLILLVNVLLYLITTYLGDARKRHKVMIWLSGLILLVTVWDIYLYKREAKAPPVKVKVAAIQANVNPNRKLIDSSIYHHLSVIEELVSPLEGKQVDLVVCSEGLLKSSGNAAIIINDIENHDVVKRLKQLSKKVNAPILTGFIGYKVYFSDKLPTPTAKLKKKGVYYDTYTAAMLVSYDQPTQIYAKSRLVPFMEKVPFVSALASMEKLHLNLNQMRGSYAPYPEPVVFKYKNMKIAPIICLESIFPDYVRQFFIKKANLIALITNDGWAGNTSGYLQHASYASYLSIQMRKTMVRAANTGISMFVDENGRPSMQTKAFQKDVIIKEIELKKHKTFYVKTGNIIGVISLIITILLVIFLLFTKKRPVKG